MNYDAVAITGLGAVSSLGRTLPLITRKLVAGCSGVKTTTDPSTATRTMGAINAPVDVIGPKRWPVNRATAFGLLAARQALAQLALTPESASELGVIHATARGNFTSLLEYQSDIRRFGLDRASPLQFPNTILHAAAGFLSVATGACAFNITVTNGNASSVEAIEMARQLLLSGAARYVLCVAAEELTNDMVSFLQSEAELDLAFPDPFGEARSGYVPGEGAVAVLLETLESAKAHQRGVLAHFRGLATSDLGQDSAKDSLSRAMQAALTNAEVIPKDIACVVAHANGSREDGAEAEAISAVFGEETPVTSLKATYGECGAVGPMLALASLIACETRGCVPPTLGRSSYDQTLPKLNLVREPSPITKRTVLINVIEHHQSACQVIELCRARTRGRTWARA